MSEPKDSLLDKAESFARRVLERMGAKVDDRASPADQQTLSLREVGEITSKIEKTIEASLRDDQRGVKRVAPNTFRVLFPYEDYTRLNSSYISALADEIRGSVFEYINNRRYETRGRVKVTAGQDLFAKTIVIKAFFEGEEPSASEKAPAGSGAASETDLPENATRAVSLTSEDGQVYHLVLRSGQGPVYIGRAAGVALRIEDSSISRLHCSLTLRQNGDIIVSDLGSSNGTTLNSQSLDPQEGKLLKPGDRLVVGDISLDVSDIT